MAKQKKKLLYIAAHLSTGGMPQYLLKQIETFMKDYQIEVVEISDHGSYRVQKDKIKSLVVVHTLGEDKSKILDVIKTFGPDVIHFQEIPQFDLASDILDKIFVNNRTYDIVASTHGSHTKPEEIVYHPDRYVLVSEWSRRRFEEADVKVDLTIWEYPITEVEYDKDGAKEKLGFEKDWKHVLMVGLFTPGKNQGEIFNVARQLEKFKIKFHFVGNQAMNFEDYWKPIMLHKPDNCVIWGEREDVHNFYEASDMFYFSSVLELNPLSVKEALGYKLPSIFRKLHTYLETYDNHPLVEYIDDNLQNTKKIILQTLKPEFNQIPGWFSYENLYEEMVETAPFNATFVEVGSWFGKSTNYLAQKIKESKKNIHFTSVDTFKGSENEKLHQDIVSSFNGDIFYEFIDNTILSDNYGTVNIIKDTSKNGANQFWNNSIDFLMIDAGHEYDEVMDDLKTWYNKVKPGGVISGDDYKVFAGSTHAPNDFFYKQFDVNFRSFVRRKPRIQIKHLLTRPDDVREKVSMSSLKQLQNYGMVYEPIINQVYTDIPPAIHCRRPEHISPDNKPGELYPGAGLGWITGRHYGCYLAHRGALETIDDVNFDYTLVFEADAFIYTGLEEFVDIVHKACFISERDNVPFIGLANNPSRSKEKIDELFSKTAFNQDLAHAYLIPNREKKWWLDRIEDCAWDVGDLWFNHVFANHQRPRYTTNKMYSKQAEGYSLLDEIVKVW
jgi:hypothetical protein